MHSSGGSHVTCMAHVPMAHRQSLGRHPQGSQVMHANPSCEGRCLLRPPVQVTRVP